MLLELDIIISSGIVCFLHDEMQNFITSKGTLPETGKINEAIMCQSPLQSPLIQEQLLHLRHR